MSCNDFSKIGIPEVDGPASEGMDWHTFGQAPEWAELHSDHG